MFARIIERALALRAEREPHGIAARPARPAKATRAKSPKKTAAKKATARGTAKPSKARTRR
jgi:hypothetical protein